MRFGDWESDGQTSEHCETTWMVRISDELQT
jgi:hypothetical protein